MGLESGPYGIEAGSGSASESEIEEVYATVHKLYQSVDVLQRNLALAVLKYYNGPKKLVPWWYEFHESLGSTPEEAIRAQQWEAILNAIQNDLLAEQLALSA